MGLLEKTQHKKAKVSKKEIKTEHPETKIKLNLSISEKGKQKKVVIKNDNKPRAEKPKKQGTKTKRTSEKNKVVKKHKTIDSKGLLEKAKQLRVSDEQDRKISDSFETIRKPNQPDVLKIENLISQYKLRDSSIVDSHKGLAIEPKSLLERAKQVRGISDKKADKKLQKIQDNIEIIEEKTGFGWKGYGTRRIILDHSNNEYVYEVLEPVLNKFEKEKKDELSRLFKMLADVNITNMEKEEKEKYIFETLEKIITENNISFIAKEEKKQKTDDKNKTGDEKTDKKKQKKFLKKEEKKEEKKTEEPKKPAKTRDEISRIEKESKEKIFYHLFKDYLGYGKIDIIMEDEGIEDISCDGHHVPIFIYHKTYDAITTNVKFDDENELNSFVVRLAQLSGKQISIYSPIVDGKLPDGSRLQTTLAKTVTKGSTFTIRKFKENPLTPVDLIESESLSLDMAAYFWLAIERGASILFCGGTASGKTTALNALSLFIPHQNKIVSIEDTREVNLPHKNWIAGTTRQGFTASDEKTGKDIDMFDLIRAALRQRPKVVIVGEVRGKEAYSLFQAMATGHTSYATVHASDIHTLIQRLENPPISLPRALLTSLDVIVFQNAIEITNKTVRRMTSVTEVIKLDPDTNQLIFMEPYRWISKTDDRFESTGASKILNNIRLQSDWTEDQLIYEIENRKLILQWMVKKKVRDYREVGKIVSDYSKNPLKLIKIAQEEVKS
jgi:flagellar protein FlaI